MRYESAGSGVRIWAPNAQRLRLETESREVDLEREPDGWFHATVKGLSVGDRYMFRIDDGAPLPDPTSLHQPEGVHGPSAVVDLQPGWRATEWDNPPLSRQVFYELHVGTFSEAGTFAGVTEHLPHLVELGVTAVELMPVAQFPGSRNWGYDGVGLYATQDSYGGPHELQRLVDDCHRAGLSVFLDVVYNHLGPEGNYLRAFGPYFTDRYRTPWGEAVNLDGPGSDHVRSFLIENALMWLDDFRFDGLRLDAVHALYDRSARPFLLELSEAVDRLAERQGRRIHLVVENAGNDPRLLERREVGGLEMDGAWNDDFHHALHVTLTGETARYYADFAEAVPDLAAAMADGYVNAGRYSPYRGRRHGAPSAHLPRSSMVVFAQNHDQVGNRAAGDRLSTLVDDDRLRFAAAATVLSPWVPMLFMGEEWAETNPFLYFVDHGDDDLLEAVRSGRREEFAGFFTGDGEVPDPAAVESFERSKLSWSDVDGERQRRMLELYRSLIRLRRDRPVISRPDPGCHTVELRDTTITIESAADDDRVLRVFNASPAAAEVNLPERGWTLLLDASEERPGDDRQVAPGTAFKLEPWGWAVFGEST